MFHYVYIITNKIDNKRYIGKHTTENLDDKYFGSSVYLKNAIKKYGKENFTKEIIRFFDSEKEAYDFESSMISEELLKSGTLYNIKGGGQGFGSGNCNLSKLASKNGNHWAAGTQSSNHRLVEEGKHFFLTDKNPSHVASVQGNHWAAGEKHCCHKQIANGTHRFQGENNPAKIGSRNGTHPRLGIKPWNHPTCHDTAKETWLLADVIFSMYKENEKTSGYKLRTVYFKKTGLWLNTKSMQNIVKHFKMGWVPKEDPEWIKFYE